MLNDGSNETFIDKDEFLVSRKDTTQLHFMSRTTERQERGLLGSLVKTLK